MKAIKYGASWCVPCSQLSKKLEQVGIKLEERDVDVHKTEAAQHGIRSVPTIVILDNDGNRMETFIGSNLTPKQMERLKELSL